MRKSYRYEGPLPLGSVGAHHCGAGGFHAVKDNPALTLKACEINGRYTLSVCHECGAHTELSDVADTDGRRRIGHDLLKFLRTMQGLSPLGDWGSLVGVRPMKLFHKLWDKTGSAGGADVELVKLYAVGEKKRQLLSEIAAIQRPYVAPRDDEDRHVSIYGGIPFCTTRCTYCSFPYGLWQDYGDQAGFKDAWLRDTDDLQALCERYDLTIDSLYMGGGTPTSPSDELFEALVQRFGLFHRMASEKLGRDCEFTVEAGRPDTVTPEKLVAMQKAGVNRISINPQSMQDDVLKAIGRGHKAQDIEELYRYVRKHTDFAVNMDFIAGLPHQTVAYMEANMDYVLTAMPENVTIHTLALKKGSPLYDGVGREAMPDEESVRYMVEFCGQRLREAGYVPYYVYRQQYMTGQMENIGYTLPGHVCEYNIRIMEERQSILSVGPGSSSKWMRGPEYRQIQLHMPKDVGVYTATLTDLVAKRAQRAVEFWEG